MCMRRHKIAVTLSLWYIQLALWASPYTWTTYVQQEKRCNTSHLLCLLYPWHLLQGHSKEWWSVNTSSSSWGLTILELALYALCISVSGYSISIIGFLGNCMSVAATTFLMLALISLIDMNSLLQNLSHRPRYAGTTDGVHCPRATCATYVMQNCIHTLVKQVCTCHLGRMWSCTPYARWMYTIGNSLWQLVNDKRKTKPQLLFKGTPK